MTVNLLTLAQQSTMPQLDGMYWLMLASRFLHILGAVIITGGLFYLRFVVSPIDSPPGTSPVDQFFGGRRAAWAKWVGIATMFLIVTGGWNYMQTIKMHEKLASSYHMIAGLKMIAAIGVFLLSALLAGRTAAADALRQNWRFWLNVCLALALVTVGLGSVLRSYPRTRLVDAPAAPALVAPLNAPAQ